MTPPTGYSRTQIGLHWIIGALIVFQLIFGESIGEAWDASMEGGVPNMTLLVWAHIVVGVSVLLLALWRVAVRMGRGAPAEAEAGTMLTKLAAKGTHLALYLLMLAVPATGLVAWYGGIEVAGEVHSWAKPVLIVLIVLHVVGALWHQFVIKDNLVARMVRPGQ